MPTPRAPEQCPAAVAELQARCMLPDPAQRPSAAEIVERLRALAPSRPPPAMPPRPGPAPPAQRQPDPAGAAPGLPPPLMPQQQPAPAHAAAQPPVPWSPFQALACQAEAPLFAPAPECSPAAASAAAAAAAAAAEAPPVQLCPEAFGSVQLTRGSSHSSREAQPPQSPRAAQHAAPFYIVQPQRPRDAVPPPQAVLPPRPCLQPCRSAPALAGAGVGAECCSGGGSSPLACGGGSSPLACGGGMSSAGEAGDPVYCTALTLLHDS